MRLALAAALLALSAGAALAQSPPGQPAPGQSAPMNGAAPAYGAGPGGYGNRPPPSPEQRAARQAMRQACAADTQKLCADAETTGERPGQCLREHRVDLSPGCTQAMQAMRAARQGGGGPAPGGPQG